MKVRNTAMPLWSPSWDFLAPLWYILVLATLAGSFCPYRCSCDDAKLVARCTEAGLDVVPITLNPELRELHLTRNHIKRIVAAFAVYQDLEYLDVSQNQLMSVGKHNFQLQSVLRVLVLNHNLISTLSLHAFSGLASLRTLMLKGNYLQEVTPHVFRPLENLHKLDLSQNGISTVADDGFVGLDKLEVLLMRDNRLKTIPQEPFHHLQNLRSLDVGINPIGEVPREAFAALPNLEKLHLDGCEIRHFQEGAFKGAASLVSLDLHNNRFRTIPSQVLADAGGLQDINLGQNEFSELESHCLPRLQFLRRLVIRGAPNLHQISSEAFAENPRLQKVVVENNANLQDAEPGAFAHLSHLRHLSLRNNGFRLIHPDLAPWYQLHFLDMRDNPLACNCSAVWLRSLLQTINFANASVSDVTQVTCGDPVALQEQLLKNLTDDDLGCFEATRRLILITSLVSVVIMVLVALAAVVWYRHQTTVGIRKPGVKERSISPAPLPPGIPPIPQWHVIPRIPRSTLV